MEITSYNGGRWQYDKLSNSLRRIGNGMVLECEERGVGNKVIVPYTVDSVSELCDGHVRNLTLNLTENCNMRCRYCVSCGRFLGERTISSRKMTFDIARAAIDWLAHASRKEREVRISFFGGEPLLETDLILKTYRYAKERLPGRISYFNVATNATLVDEKILDWLAHDEKTTIAITLNGPADVHNRERVFANGTVSYESVLRGVYAVLRVLKNPNRLTIQCNYRDLLELARQQNWFRSQKVFAGVSILYSKIRPSEPATEDERQVQERQRTRDRACELALRRRTVNEAKRLKRLPPILRTGDSLLPIFSVLMNKKPQHKTIGHQGVCTPIVSRASVDVTGNIFFCEKSYNTSVLGNVLREGINKERLFEHVSSCNQLFDRLGCRDCETLFYCCLCAADFYRKGELRSLKDIGAVCIRMRSRFVEDLIWYVSLLEKNKELRLPCDVSGSDAAFVYQINDSARKVVSAEFS